jgi:hypothetical protein
MFTMGCVQTLQKTVRNLQYQIDIIDQANLMRITQMAQQNAPNKDRNKS